MTTRRHRNSGHPTHELLEVLLRMMQNLQSTARPPQTEAPERPPKDTTER